VRNRWAVYVVIFSDDTIMRNVACLQGTGEGTSRPAFSVGHDTDASNSGWAVDLNVGVTEESQESLSKRRRVLEHRCSTAQYVCSTAVSSSAVAPWSAGHCVGRTQFR
jgi:hypothetical protein